MVIVLKLGLSNDYEIADEAVPPFYCQCSFPNLITIPDIGMQLYFLKI